MGDLAKILLVFATLGCSTAPQVPERPPRSSAPIEAPAEDAAPIEDNDDAAAESEAPASEPVLVNDAALGGFTLEERREGLLIRVDTIEPFGPDADALALGFVESIPRLYACYQQHPVAGRSWLGVEVGKNGPRSIRVRLGPDEVDPRLESCAREALATVRVPDESSVAVFGLSVFGEAADAVALPKPEPGQRVEVRYGAGCYRWIEEPPCPPRKRCYVDRWELSRCSD